MSSYQNSNNSSSSNSNHSISNNINNNSNNNNSNSGNNNNSSNSNSADSKKDEFRRYLEKTNVIDSLTKVLVGLYEEPERPANAVDYIRKYLGAPANVDVDSLKRENKELRQSMDGLTKQVEALQVSSTAAVAAQTIGADPPSTA